MKVFIVGAFALALSLCVYTAEHKDSWQRTFALSGAGERKLAVEIINGNIRVSGDSGSDIRVTVREEYRTDTAEDLATARNDFKLRIDHEGNSVRLYLDPPECNCRGRERNRMNFNHDVEVQVPRDIAVSLRTINGGELSVSAVNGNWKLKNINGGIEMKDMGGYGEAETLNGALRATFVKNPPQASRFKNLNGVIDVSFQPDLSADLSFSTMNGEAYTDFEIAPVPMAAEVGKSSDGFRYRVSNRNKKVRVGTGGVEHSFSTLNGSIKIRKYGNKI